MDDFKELEGIPLSDQVEMLKGVILIGSQRYHKLRAELAEMQNAFEVQQDRAGKAEAQLKRVRVRLDTMIKTLKPNLYPSLELKEVRDSIAGEGE